MIIHFKNFIIYLCYFKLNFMYFDNYYYSIDINKIFIDFIIIIMVLLKLIMYLYYYYLSFFEYFKLRLLVPKMKKIYLIYYFIYIFQAQYDLFHFNFIFNYLILY